MESDATDKPAAQTRSSQPSYDLENDPGRNLAPTGADTRNAVKVEVGSAPNVAELSDLALGGDELLESKFADTATRLMMSVPLSLRRSGLRWP
jgi:hypothetical protein